MDWAEVHADVSSGIREAVSLLAANDGCKAGGTAAEETAKSLRLWLMAKAAAIRQLQLRGIGDARTLPVRSEKAGPQMAACLLFCAAVALSIEIEPARALSVNALPQAQMLS